MSVKLVKDKKFEFLYIRDAVAYFASVHKPSKKYQQEEREYKLTAFLTKEDRDQLEDVVKINKQLFEVGVDKNKKRAVKFRTSDQTEKKDDPNYDEVKGLHGVQFTLNELTKSGKKNKLAVVDKEGKLFKEDIGNGSKVNLKLFGYRNDDGLLVVSLQIVQVVEHVAYEKNPGRIVDDEFGVNIDMSEYEEDVVEVEDVVESEDF